MAKTVLIPQTTFTAQEQGSDYTYKLGNYELNQDKIIVSFDGVNYEVEKVTTHAVNYYVDDSIQPFYFYIMSQFIDRTMTWLSTIFVNDGNEHTIEVYVEDEPVVTVQKPGVQVLQLDERLIIFDETTGDIVTFDGENWQLGSDNFGEAIMPSKYAVVGTAIVGKDVVAPGEPTPPQPEPEDEYNVLIIPETKFTGTKMPFGGELYDYIFEYVLMETNYKVLFDGTKYILNSTVSDGSYDYGAPYVDGEIPPYDFSTYPFNLRCGRHSDSGDYKTWITVQDGNEHTIAVYGRKK